MNPDVVSNLAKLGAPFSRLGMPSHVDVSNAKSDECDVIVLMRHLASSMSISRSALALGISQHDVHRELCRANNLSDVCLARLGGLDNGDFIELTNEGHELLPERVVSLFDVFLAQPQHWRGKFLGFHRRRSLLNRLETKMSARNRLYGRICSLRLSADHVHVELDLGRGKRLTATVGQGECREMGLVAGTECSLLIAPEDILLTIDPAARHGLENTIAAKVSVHQDITEDGVVLDLGDGKTLIAQLTDEESAALGLHVDAPVWALVSSSHVILTVDSVEPGQEHIDDHQPTVGKTVNLPVISSFQGAAMETSAFTYDSLMAHARNPLDSVTRALAGAIASAAAGHIEAPNLALGLSRSRYSALLAQHFPGAESQTCVCGEACREGCRPLRGDEFQDLVELLLSHRSNEEDATEWLAYAIASACMGGNHLYQDMGLPNRQALSELLKQHFTRLFEKNAGNMKWKKFFYKQLCDQAQVRVCQAPSCQVCDDYWNCFGPEDDSFPASLTASVKQAPAGAAT